MSHKDALIIDQIVSQFSGQYKISKHRRVTPRSSGYDENLQCPKFVSLHFILDGRHVFATNMRCLLQRQMLRRLKKYFRSNNRLNPFRSKEKNEIPENLP